MHQYAYQKLRFDDKSIALLRFGLLRRALLHDDLGLRTHAPRTTQLFRPQPAAPRRAHEVARPARLSRRPGVCVGLPETRARSRGDDRPAVVVPSQPRIGLRPAT